MNQVRIDIATYREQQEIIDNIVEAVLSPAEKLNSVIKFDALKLNAIYLLAYLDLQPVGIVRITDIDEQRARIDRLVILPEAQNRGIETRLMDRALDLVEINDFELVLIRTKQGCDAVCESIYDRHRSLQIECSWEIEIMTPVSQTQNSNNFKLVQHRAKASSEFEVRNSEL